MNKKDELIFELQGQLLELSDEILHKIRPCEVTLTIDKQKVKKQGWFHLWEQYAYTVGESALRGGPASGQVSCVLAIVELEDGRVVRVHPWEMEFTDRRNNGVQSETETAAD